MVTTARPPLLCLSHLRWDFVWQRPQHVMSRLARDRQLFFVEEPLFRPEAPPVAEATLALRQEGGVTVAQPVCRDPGPGGGPALDAMFTRLVADAFGPQHLVWGSGAPGIVDAHLEHWGAPERAAVKGATLARLLRWT